MNAQKKSFSKYLQPLLWLMVLIALGFAIFQTNLPARLSINANPLQRLAHGSFSALEVLKSPPSTKDLKFFDANGKEVTLEKLEGKIKVVNIWATWCPPCVREMPELARFQERNKSKGVIVIPISVDKFEDVEKARQQLGKLSNNQLEFYSDHTMTIPFPLLVKGFPTTIFYNEKNQEVARIPSAPKWDDKEADQIIDAIIAQ